MTEEQWEKLAEFIRNEARYAADDIMGRNGCSDAIRRYEIREEARKAFVRREE